MFNISWLPIKKENTTQIKSKKKRKITLYQNVRRNRIAKKNGIMLFLHVAKSF